MPQQKKNRRQRPSRPVPPAEMLEVTIASLGHEGDGVAEISGEKVFVPGALPDERVKIERRGNRAKLLEVLRASADRRKAPCPYFEDCGGCALQHLTPEAETTFKHQRLVEALQREGVQIPKVGSVMSFPDGVRRRAALGFWKQGGKVAFGFKGKRSHENVGIEECLVIRPELNTAAQRLCEPLGGIIRAKPVQAHMTSYQNGVDIDLLGTGLDPEDLTFEQMECLSALTAIPEVARLSLDGVLYLQKEAPLIDFGGVRVSPPIGAFLQASNESQNALQELVVSSLAQEGKIKRIADLFCGCGTFSFPLAKKAEVMAFDSDKSQVEALRNAAQAVAENRISAEARDLFRRPLVEKELKGFDVVVLNPARAGARDQVERLANSTVRRIVYVSCNPVTFARDAKILQSGGYQLAKLTPVDQFKHAAHLECVGLFEKN